MILEINNYIDRRFITHKPKPRCRVIKNKHHKYRKHIAILLAAYYIGSCNSNYSYDQMFTSAAATCPALSSALDGVSGKNILKGLALSESGMNPSAMSPAGYDGSYSWGIMQINTSSHPGYGSWRLRSNTRLNIQVGASDLCSKLMHYGNIYDAIARYKGWFGYNSCETAKEQTNTAIDLMEQVQEKGE